MKNQRGSAIIEILFVLVVVIALAAYMGNADESVRKEAIHKLLTRDVDMQQVPMKGQKIFRAQVQIIYKDGKVETVKLIPGTTTSETVTQK